MVRVLIVMLALLAAGADAGAKRRVDTATADAVGQFDYYVLTLSWSPVYCEKHPDDSQQCGSARYGFVLHGLWPQYANGGYPSTCAAGARLTEEARNFGRTVFPSEKLVAHEWRKHGTCSGMEAKAYFKAADDARNAIRIPEQLQPGSRTQQTTAQAVSKAIRDSNPSITNRGLAVVCSGPELAEVRVCLSRDLRPVACGSGVRDSCRKGTIRVPGVR
ncbi:ribonuclease T2 [Piscinibacter sp. XHJ-5]|uniref:ribonuclease T2 n=1 Tax=Piscinibacter sp. XHJ-5 TaxID=3037797 RepID=UPI0024530CE7|nr:ribonuclease T2 [Piscinibacter sp. XHJ-5]